jgi:drug/metabolite transporter (DMT)-like permease|tara:strand:- start:3083 stop:3991 length:909 start_codon:yes stop_codon:yes gene_type:complete
MFENFRYHLLLHIIIFIWGFTGILGKLIHLESLSIVWWRVVIAFIALGIYLKFKKWNFKVHSRKQLYTILGVGVLVSLHWILFYKSIQLSTASLGILCLSTTTLHVTWLEPLIMKRRFLISEFISGILIICALIYVSGDFSATDYTALFLGLTSALMAALFSVFNAKLVQETSSQTISFYEFGIAVVFLSILLGFEGRLNASLFVMTTSDFLWLLFLGIVCTSFAFLVVVDLVKRLGAFTVSLSINMEPVYTIFLAIAILNENAQLSNKFYIGAAIIVAIVVLNAVIKYRMKMKNTAAFDGN